MNLLATETITVVRKNFISGQTYINGLPVDNPFEIVTYTDIACNIQALGGDETLLLPEGDRNKEPIVIHSVFEIKVNDIITNSDSENFEVQKVEDYNRYGLPIDHYVSFATKIVEAL